MRGTLHVLPLQLGASCLALMASARSWEKASWQRTFVTAAELETIAQAVHGALGNRVLTREQLVHEVLERTGDPDVADHLRSGWGAVLKPLAWQGLLCNGPSAGGNVTFTRPDTYFDQWPGLPDPADAARLVILTYLAAFGPVRAEIFDAWLSRGATRRATLRQWFESLEGDVIEVDVEGTKALARACDVEEMAATPPSSAVRLLPGFDQYVLAPGTKDAHILSPTRRSQVSRAAGWISPVVVASGRIVGTWEHDGNRLVVTPFDDSGLVSTDALESETHRVSRATGSVLTLAVNTANSAKA